LRESEEKGEKRKRLSSSQGTNKKNNRNLDETGAKANSAKTQNQTIEAKSIQKLRAVGG
jgi:hypothetical protein